MVPRMAMRAHFASFLLASLRQGVALISAAEAAGATEEIAAAAMAAAAMDFAKAKRNVLVPMASSPNLELWSGSA
jgi:hypothetical protein